MTSLKFTTGIALLAFAATAIAGPGADFWTRRAATSAPKAATSGTDCAAPAHACPACKTESVTEFRSTLPNGKSTPNWVTVGTSHTCGHCEGAITKKDGVTKDAMKDGCGAASTCCKPEAKPVANPHACCS